MELPTLSSAGVVLEGEETETATKCLYTTTE